jgi:hypothetical protein
VDRLGHAPQSELRSQVSSAQPQLADKLVRLLAELPQPDSPRRKSVRSLAAAMNRFAWDNLIEEYDAELERLPRYGTRATTSLS